MALHGTIQPVTVSQCSPVAYWEELPLLSLRAVEASAMGCKCSGRVERGLALGSSKGDLTLHSRSLCIHQEEGKLTTMDGLASDSIS